jgi:diacylglycerol kinase family enzyme
MLCVDAMVHEARRIDVIINLRSGAPGNEALADRIAGRLSSRGASAHVELIRRPDDLSAAVERVAAGDAGIVVAGGGDGTITAAATGLLDTGKSLGVLPLGTFNYFAQRIGVPLDLDGALDVILAAKRPKTLSVGEVNGRVFLNSSSIGLYPAVLAQRERTYRRIGRRSQAAAYLATPLALIQPPGLLDLRLTADGTPIARRTPLLFVGVNPHQLASFGIAGHECVEAGRLATYITRPLGPSRLGRLALRAFFRGLHGTGEIEVICARELYVTLRRKRVRVALDGEIARLHTPLRYRLRANALRVLTGDGVPRQHRAAAKRRR